jgi:hypothetical protein
MSTALEWCYRSCRLQLEGARVSDMEDNEGEEVEMVLGRMVNKNLQLDSSTEQSWIPDFVDTLG